MPRDLSLPAEYPVPAARCAIQQGDATQGRMLLSKGAGLASVGGGRFGAMETAVQDNRSRVFFELARAGALTGAGGQRPGRQELGRMLAAASGFHPGGQSVTAAQWAYYSAPALELLRLGADPNAVGQLHQTPLMAAASVGNETLTRALLAHGADPTYCTGTMTPQTAATFGRNPNVVGDVLAAITPQQRASFASDALTWAVGGTPYIQVTAELLGSACSSRACGPVSTPYLRWAASSGDWPEAALLLSWGADLRAKDAHGHTAIALALANGHVDVAKRLLAGGSLRQWTRAATEDERRRTARKVWMVPGGRPSPRT